MSIVMARRRADDDDFVVGALDDPEMSRAKISRARRVSSGERMDVN